MRALPMLLLLAACDHTARAPLGPTPADLSAALSQLEAAPTTSRHTLAIATATRLCGKLCPCLADPALACGDGADPGYDRLDEAARYLAHAVARAPEAERPALQARLDALRFTLTALDEPVAMTSAAMRPLALDAPIVVIGADGSAHDLALPVYAIGPTGLRPVVTPVAPRPSPVLSLGLSQIGRGGGRGTEKGDTEDAMEESFGGEDDFGDPTVLEFTEMDLDLPAAKAGLAWRVTEAEFGASRSAAEPIIAIAPGAPVTSAVWALADRGGALAVVSGGAPAELAARFAAPRVGAGPVALTVVITGRQMSISRRLPPTLAWQGDRDPIALAKTIASVPLGDDATVELFVRDATAADLVRALDPLIARGPRWVRIAAPMPN